MGSATDPENRKTLGNQGALSLIIGAIGVVFGDIGTSPLYALRECFSPSHGIALNAPNVFGVLSLIFWSLTLVITFKYLVVVLRADNKGEGGTMALMALLTQAFRKTQPGLAKPLCLFAGLIGAALLYGDGAITPAISVLSAVEGLAVATPAFEPVVLPVTIVILLTLFWVQKKGTAKLGAIFGPAVVLWFVSLILVGLPWILKRPEILFAVNPVHALAFFASHGSAGFLVLSAVVLVVTGGEALYADMGHFGRRPIQYAWLFLAMPALLINYFGQGALILSHLGTPLESQIVAQPFYGLVSSIYPSAFLYPLVFIATVATVVASQAVISGAYSLSQQAVQLGYLPRIAILHTSRTTRGQVYVPRINQLLMLVCLALVIAFPRSSDLAAAYGLAVTGTMLMTSVLLSLLAHYVWNWPGWKTALICGGFIGVDLAFLGANLSKFIEGGWIPVLIGVAMFLVMSTWKKGRDAMAHATTSKAVPLPQFLGQLDRKRPVRVPGSAVFMTLTENVAPIVMLHHFKHNHVLHEQILLLSIVTSTDPEVSQDRRVKVSAVRPGIYKVSATYGYMQSPDVSEILIYCLGAGVPLDPDDVSFFLGRESFLLTGHAPLSTWRKKLFVLMSRNARPATDYFKLPPDQVSELGSQIAI